MALTPSKKSVSSIKSSLLRPALTSHYDVYILPPNDLVNELRTAYSLIYPGLDQEIIQLSCSEASLPGSSLITHEISNDYTGVTERHAYRRLYDDRIDLTFYVDTNYKSILFFEVWLKYIVNEQRSTSYNVEDREYSYRVKYPSKYYADKFTITKFERTSRNEKGLNYGGTNLTYTFINAFPISINSMPISYDSSSLLKCTVSLSYSRYYIDKLNVKEQPRPENTKAPGNPELKGTETRRENVRNGEYISSQPPILYTQEPQPGQYQSSQPTPDFLRY